MSNIKHNHPGISFDEDSAVSKHCPRCRLDNAALDLLEACERVMKEAANNSGRITIETDQIVNDAISKAKGESQ